MSGCYGNSFEDKYWENRLMNYLDQYEIEECPKCHEIDCEWCPDCKNHSCECECMEEENDQEIEKREVSSS